MIDLGNHFRRDETRHSEWLRQRQWFIKAREDREKRAERTEKLEDDLAAMGMEVVMATEIQIREFEEKLDTYEAATVTALMENQKQLDLVNARIEAMLAQAYVMEDGRRVFKTQDGTQVFDEFGEEVSPEELDFDLISADRPTAEDYLRDLGEREALLSERSDLLEYQQKLDDARERVSEGEISEADLEELDKDLLEVMPDRVREHTPGIDAPEIAATANTADQPAVSAAEVAKDISHTAMTPGLNS
ncbi:MAG: hypothetical protein AAF542_07375 [Pseudomonadota bacterium]